MILSVIIPARNEFPNIVHTAHSILNTLEADGFNPKEIEIILVDNGSTDNDYWPQRASKGTSAHLMPRGIYWSRVLRVLYDPICGNHSARNKGATIARGEYLFFSDAHMSYVPGFFKSILKTVDESKGLVHGAIAWMGGYPHYANDGNLHGVGVQYSIKLGEEIKGTWNNYVLDREKWFYIPSLGHCSVAVKKDQFMKFRGYPRIHRTYGGGEFYLDMKWWMLGSTVAVDPKAIGYHLYSYRGYTYNHDDYLTNVLGISYALGMDDWRERTYINWLRKGRKDVLDGIMVMTEKEYAEDRAWIEKKRSKTFNEVIVERPWDRMNDKRLGKHYSGLTIFHDTWLPLLEGTPAHKAYQEAKYQKQLEEFINANLGEFVYRRKATSQIPKDETN